MNLPTVTLETAGLRSGETMTILKAGWPPDPGSLTDTVHAVALDDVMHLLGHKDEKWLEQIQMVGSRQARGLENRFYLGRVAGRLVANVMIAEAGGLGILGHVYTEPQWRRQGIASQLCRSAVKDFDARGGSVLYLVTGYGSGAYRLYERFGFASMAPESGIMVRPAGGDRTSQQLLAPATGEELTVSPWDWGAWPQLAALYSIPGGTVLRNLQLGIIGPGSFESPGLDLFKKLGMMSPDDPLRAAARVLRRPGGLPAAAAAATFHPLWPETGLLDLFAHPDTPADSLAELAAATAAAAPFAPNTWLAYEVTDPPHGTGEASIRRRQGLLAAGWRKEADIRRPWKTLHGDTGERVAVYRRQRVPPTT